MNPSKHVYYITANDVQEVAKATVGRPLRSDELERIVERLLDKIQWYEAIEDLLLTDVEPVRKL